MRTWPFAVNLLSEQELDYVERMGVPFPPREDLVVFDANGAPVFTVKGRQFYRAACWLNAVEFVPEALTCRAQVEDLGCAVDRAGLLRAGAQLHAELLLGRVPAQERALAQALVRGCVDDITRCSELTRAAQAAGPAVIPVDFTRKT